MLVETRVRNYMGKVDNFEYGNFDIEKFNFENGNFEFDLILILIWPPMG